MNGMWFLYGAASLQKNCKDPCTLGPPNRHFFPDDGSSVDWKTDEGSSVERKFHKCVKI